MSQKHQAIIVRDFDILVLLSDEFALAKRLDAIRFALPHTLVGLASA